MGALGMVGRAFFVTPDRFTTPDRTVG